MMAQRRADVSEEVGWHPEVRDRETGKMLRVGIRRRLFPLVQLAKVEHETNDEDGRLGTPAVSMSFVSAQLN